MTTPEPSLPSGGQNREALAMLEITHTDVSPAIVRWLVGFFLAVIAAVPLAEAIYAWTSDGGGIAIAGEQLSAAVTEARAAVVQAPASSAEGRRGLWGRVVAGNAALLVGLSGFERALEDDSLIARTLRPPAQLAMTAWLGAGNERVYPGRDGWLFYRPDVEYVTGRPFLDPAELARRVREAPVSAPPPQPDPLQAILALDTSLKARGIMLVVMPTPHKPAIHPEKLAEGLDGAGTPFQNPSFREFLERLTRDGVQVYDPRRALVAASSTGARYLATDTHWRPETMTTVASGLAGFIVERVSLPAVEDPGYRTALVTVQNAGDTARMLDLPSQVTRYPAETVPLTRVMLPDGSPWRSVRAADVLVLGDSFSNIYSLESMGWGTSAGFVEHLSHALRRPVDRVVQNDEGAFATRAMLARDPDRLRGKRVVVYQFAERELAFGDWKLVE